MQTRLSSLIESLINVAIGFVVSLGLMQALFPEAAFSTNLRVTLLFTATSIARQYVVRRWFNARIHRTAERLARL